MDCSVVCGHHKDGPHVAVIDSDVLLSRFSRMSLAERKMARSVALTRRGRAGAIAVRGCQVPSGGEAAFTMGSDGAGADVREDDGPGQGGTDRKSVV